MSTKDETSSNRRISRRKFLKWSAAGAAGSILAGAVPEMARAAGGFDSLSPETDEEVYFRGWQYKTQIVKQNVNRYNEEMNGNVNYSTVTGDYPSLMETKLIAGAPLDVFYANPTQAVRYNQGNWLLPAEELPNADRIKEDLFDGIRDAWTYNGKLLGLSYFTSTRGAMHTNEQKLREAGWAADTPENANYPENWSELYDQLYELRDKGVSDTPFLPHWLGEWYGIQWAFPFEVHNRGGRIADENQNPVLHQSDVAFEVLKDWKRIWKDELVPHEVLGYLEPDYLNAWGSGEFVYSPQQLYDLKRFNNPRYSEFAGDCSIVPYQGQSWGVLDTAMYLMSNRDRSPGHTRDVKRFASWYGYRDQTGDIFVGRKWMRTSMLFTGYKPILEDPETKRMMSKEFLMRPEDYDSVMGVYSNTPFPKNIWHTVWAPELGTYLKETLHSFLQEDKPVKETVHAIRDKIHEFNERYGG